MSSTLSSGSESWVVEAWSPGLPAPEANRVASAATNHYAAVQAEFIIRAITQLLQCHDPADACRLLANRLQQSLGCRQVAVGLCDQRRKRCRVRGLSGAVRFDTHSGLVSAVQDALDEALVRGCLTCWPPADDTQRHGALAHQKLVSLLGAECVVSLPLRDGDDGTVGMIQLIDEPSPAALTLLQHHAAALAAVLGRLQRDQPGYISRALRQLSRRCASWRGRAVLLAAVVALGCLAVPVPHRVTCRCQVQPVTRRFVVAPYDGTLEKCLVSPGDVVRSGDVLARMDQREIQWELAGLQADRARAEKERDAAMAAHKTSSAQLAELEMQRLELHMQLLEHRLTNLAVRSPIAGIVVTGDLEKAEGAPLTIGQSLFEIAPLEKMLCEVSIPEKDIAHVQTGMPVTVSLDACPDQAIDGAIQRTHPRAELRDNESVFVADMELDNSPGQLRPGMNGSAKVSTGYRSLGWILFHEPWSRVRRMLAW
jgi:RND family efflux transporter MFP subunit